MHLVTPKEQERLFVRIRLLRMDACQGGRGNQRLMHIKADEPLALPEI